METTMQNVVALVTGGASGMGKCAAEMIIKNGGKVVIADVNTAGEDVATEMGENAVFIQTNVTSEKDVMEALKLTKEKFGKLNVLINCAGIIGGEPFYDFDIDQPHSIDGWNKYFEVNTFGTFNVIRLAMAMMKENEPDKDKQRGVIINIGSIAGYGISDGYLAYGASKAAVMSMTEPLARFLAPLGIRVLALAPGLCDTTMLTNTLSTEEQNFFINETMNPVRLGKPEEMAHLMKCLIENHFMNAEVIRIDAGHRPCNKKCNPIN
ncbi:3-hydroxyacyl-CoA dehydrogenase type-2 [Diachasma alloeum]|uniref:3-hydroxyacyl-CoA dehydrogenase type-2 n=1 Tax=Diachasma alloeum TaxID=454923 RepID=UPI0007381F98|nr:3-hydroxyacyl-CoA dehydrogenase type-2 [Diachasma alloeum]